MQFQIPINIPPISPQITYRDKIVLTGSCFTEHIGKYLSDAKFQTLENPNGIVFDPLSIHRNVIHWIENRPPAAEELFLHNEVWYHWDFHSLLGQMDPSAALDDMSKRIAGAHRFLARADWLIITLGTSFAYKYLPENRYVANCHKVPNNQFEKHLCTIEEIIQAFDIMLYRLFHFNPGIKVMFTVSPVRHIKDGIVENNRSKARLIEAVHHLVDKFERIYYFPSYEILIDVLRDYRFYDADLVHPNYAGTEYVLERFRDSCIASSEYKVMERMQKLGIAMRHRPFQPDSEAHKNFRQRYYQESMALQKAFPELDFTREITFFK